MAIGACSAPYKATPALWGTRIAACLVGLHEHPFCENGIADQAPSTWRML